MTEDPKRRQFESAYRGKPPWDSGRPQSPFVAIADQIRGSVLDVGCGTGDNALFFAQRGHAVLGIDFIELPLEQARRKARELGIQAEFLQMDALRLGSFDRAFDNVIDCGLLHVLSDADRAVYVQGLAHVTRPGGVLLLMCFSDEEPGNTGPRRVSAAEIRAAFAQGWTIESIEAARFQPNPHVDQRAFSDGGPRAWFAVLRRDQ